MVSMYGIYWYTYIWLILMINVGTYTIVPWIRHGKQRFVSFKLLERPMPHLWRSRWRFQTFLIFTPILGEMIQFDEYIFRMGWNKPSTTCFFLKSETCFFSHPGHSNSECCESLHVFSFGTVWWFRNPASTSWQDENIWWLVGFLPSIVLHLGYLWALSPNVLMKTRLLHKYLRMNLSRTG